MRIPIILAFVALALCGCNANQAVNPSSQPASQVFAGHYEDYNPYNPSATHRTTPGVAAAVKRPTPRTLGAERLRENGPRGPQLLNPTATCAKLSCAPASSPLNWRTRMRIPIILVFVALALAGCNANQAINPSGQANLCANDPSCNPYNPSSYAQNNVGIGR